MKKTSISSVNSLHGRLYPADQPVSEPDSKTAQNARYRLFVAFAIFGLLNNGTYLHPHS